MSDSDNYQLIGPLLDEFLAELREGGHPDIEQYTLRQPELADEIREALSAMMMVEGADKESAGSRAMSLPKIPKRIGEFEIVRELGRGGMGLVFEAVQSSLDRRVALKILKWDMPAESDQSARFMHEAQAAARLHHTNIVPVFQVGESEGVFFYAMQLIEGSGLDHVIRDLEEQFRRNRSQPADLKAGEVNLATTLKLDMARLTTNIPGDNTGQSSATGRIDGATSPTVATLSERLGPTRVLSTGCLSDQPRGPGA